MMPITEQGKVLCPPALVMGAIVRRPQLNLKMEFAKFTSKMQTNNPLIVLLILKFGLCILAVFTAD